MTNDFDGRVALVTGGSRGIGFAIARELTSRGCSVVLTARKQPELDAAVSSLGAHVAVAARGSADDEEHQAQAVALAHERFGGLHFLVNNAAVNPQYGPLVDAQLTAVRKVFEVNVTAVLGWVQQVSRGGFLRDGGSIVNIASVGGLRVGASTGAYNVSKAAVIHLTRQLAVELAPRVRVNALAPGLIKTDFATAIYEGREDEARQPYPLQRLGLPADIAKATAFLLSDASAWITGETIVVDGGLTLPYLH